MGMSREVSEVLAWIMGRLAVGYRDEEEKSLLRTARPSKQPSSRPPPPHLSAQSQRRLSDACTSILRWPVLLNASSLQSSDTSTHNHRPPKQGTSRRACMASRTHRSRVLACVRCVCSDIDPMSSYPCQVLDLNHSHSHLFRPILPRLHSVVPICLKAEYPGSYTCSHLACSHIP